MNELIMNDAPACLHPPNYWDYSALTQKHISHSTEQKEEYKSVYLAD